MEYLYVAPSVEKIAKQNTHILTWLPGCRVKIVIFLSFFRISIPKRDLGTEKTTPDVQVCPGSLKTMFEHWHIVRGLVSTSYARLGLFELILILIAKLKLTFLILRETTKNRFLRTFKQLD